MQRLMYILSAIVAATAVGCAPDTMNDMMDGMGGRQGDMRAPVRPPIDVGDPEPADLGVDAEIPDTGERVPEPGPPLTVHDLSLRGSFRSYHLLDPPIQPGDDFEHPPFDVQLGTQGIRHLHFEISYNTSNVFEVYAHGLLDLESHCLGSIHRCFDPIGAWSRLNRRHAPIVVLIDKLEFEPPNFWGVLDAFQFFIELSFDRDQIYTMGDLQARHPGMTVREIITGPGWPPLDEMRGKFIFLLGEPMARESQRNLDWGLDAVDELLMWLYADGYSDEELAADDAAIALMRRPIADEADVARARQLIDAGFLTYSTADDAEAYARATAAGVHIIASRYPDRLFPAPGAEGWPVGCNPYTAPAGCQTRQIENRRPPDAE